MNKYTYLQEVVPRLMAEGRTAPLDIPLDWYLAAPEAAQRALILTIRCANAPLEYTVFPGAHVHTLEISRAKSLVITGNVPNVTLRSCKELTEDTFRHALCAQLSLVTCAFQNNALTITTAPTGILHWWHPAGDLTVIGSLIGLRILGTPARWSYTSTNGVTTSLHTINSFDDVLPFTGMQAFMVDLSPLRGRQSIAPLLWEGLLRITALNPAHITERDLFAIANLPKLMHIFFTGAMPEKTFIDMASKLLFRLRKRPAGSPMFTMRVRDLQLTRSKVPSVPKYITLTAVVRKIVADLNAVPNVYSEMPILAN